MNNTDKTLNRARKAFALAVAHRGDAETERAYNRAARREAAARRRYVQEARYSDSLAWED